MPPKGRVGLETGDLNAVHSASGGVTGDLLRCCTKLRKQSFGVDCGAVGLRVGGLEEAAFEESRTLAGLENAHHNQTFETSNFEGLA